MGFHVLDPVRLAVPDHPRVPVTHSRARQCHRDSCAPADHRLVPCELKAQRRPGLPRDRADVPSPRIPGVIAVAGLAAVRRLCPIVASPAARYAKEPRPLKPRRSSRSTMPRRRRWRGSWCSSRHGSRGLGVRNRREPTTAAPRQQAPAARAWRSRDTVRTSRSVPQSLLASAHRSRAAGPGAHASHPAARARSGSPGIAPASSSRWVATRARQCSPSSPRSSVTARPEAVVAARRRSSRTTRVLELVALRRGCSGVEREVQCPQVVQNPGVPVADLDPDDLAVAFVEVVLAELPGAHLRRADGPCHLVQPGDQSGRHWTGLQVAEVAACASCLEGERDEIVAGRVELVAARAQLSPAR